MGSDDRYTWVLASLVAIVALTGLVINYSNAPSGAVHWSQPVLSGDWHDLGVNVEQGCMSVLSRDSPAYTKDIHQADWRECRRDGCVNACATLGTPDQCIRTCIEGAEQFSEQIRSLGGK